MQKEWQLSEIRSRTRVGWVATGIASILDHGEKKVGLQEERHQSWVTPRNRVGWVATRRASTLGHADDQGRLGCNRNGNNLRSGRGPEWVGYQSCVMVRRRLGC